VLSGVLGLYTVPTHALFLASAYSWLALQTWRAGGRQLLVIGAMGGLTLLGAGLLYAPLLLLSGVGSLLHNSYVQALPAAAFWRAVPEGLREPHHLLHVPVVVAVLGAFGYVWRLGQLGRLPAPLRRAVAALGGPGYWLFGLPYALAAVLLLPLPERTLFYKAHYLLVLAALLVEWVAGRVGTPRGQRRLRAALLAGTLGLASSQLWQLHRQEALWRHSWAWQLGAPAVEWLAAQPVGPVLAPGPYHCLVLRFYAHCAHRDRPWQIDYAPRAGVAYRYLVRAPQALAPADTLGPGFRNALLAITVKRHARSR
jgi:hypothetical protein